MENPPRVSRTDGTHVASKAGPKRKNRYTVDESGDLIECSGKYCQSCTAGFIADCVALCCCPCALVNILALAFVKLPWMIGRRCLGRVKKKKKKKKKLQGERKCRKSSEAKGEGDIVEVDRDREFRKERAEEEISEIATGLGEVEEIARFSARFEAESIWLELYQVGHLGFGRVSFTGIQS